MFVSDKDRGKLITISKADVTYKGYLVKVADLQGQQEITIKLLDNGYNIGVIVDKDTRVTLESEKKPLGKKHKLVFKQNKDLPAVCLVSTGGTIGTHVDYKTGGVSMSRTPEEILSTVPELLDIVNIKKIESLALKGSEDLSYKDWQRIAEKVYEQLVNPEIKGVIISHGTDTLAWTGSALSFMLENVNKPVLLVGAQRSPDRASFDGAMNLICAAQFVKEDVPGVYIVMHGSINDDFCNVIRATKCRKMHSSRRDAFRAVNDTPIAKVFSDGKVDYQKSKDLLKAKPGDSPKLFSAFSDTVALIKAYPNSDPKIIDWYVKRGYRGLVIEGTGLGHCPTGFGGVDKSFDKKKSWLSHIRKATQKDVIVIMTSQCLFGRVNGNVYANLRYIQEAGCSYLDQHDMLPEVAYIKLGVALSRFKDREEILSFMAKNIAGEISKKEIPESFDNFDM